MEDKYIKQAEELLPVMSIGYENEDEFGEGYQSGISLYREIALSVTARLLRRIDKLKEDK